MLEEGKTVIPRGFYYVTGTKNTGFVISDNKEDEKNENSNKGNQFVFVPVRKEEWKRFDEIEEEGYVEEIPEELEKSVKKYRGFYIGRYEAGSDETSDIVTKKGAQIYNSGITATKAIELSEKYTPSESVKSHLLYGTEWDVTCMWLLRCGVLNGIYQSGRADSTWGNNPWYNSSVSDDKKVEGAGDKVFTAGYSEYWKKNNIYDLQGNALEMTQEKKDNLNVMRSGNYYNWYAIAVGGRATHSVTETGVIAARCSRI